MFLLNVRGEMCPKQCDCDMEGGLNRALCENQNIASIDVGVPRGVQVYVLNNNVITELENFCFKELGYNDISILNLSNNHIFWIGLRAFSALDHLTNLDLSNNRLRYLPSDLFWDTPKLEYLDLSGNIFESLKNEPFLMHTVLKVLNLSNCRIKSLPDRVFTRLPNLRKLDLSDNYMISINIALLTPLRKLGMLKLQSEYVHCEREFMTVESWIESKGIEYEKQCKRLIPKQSEKMIYAVDETKDELDVSKVWNITKNNSTVIPKESKNQTVMSYPTTQVFIMGLEVGLAVGILGTYFWLKSLCKCGALSCRRPQTRRQQRRTQRIADTELRQNLLWASIITPDLETPPSSRRQLSLPDRAPPFPTFGLNSGGETTSQVADSSRSETPPPPYHECSININ
ncbi:Slit homolog 3 protein [Eumeta japonica]|uniref:Slit homolog 3 protein n=1 Tax=Eumeta variegata TaxID=151549 RepID=A0A4C1T9C7_EUMVA|nr:Slit homolog 3 protein [Eumeta japonica]